MEIESGAFETTTLISVERCLEPEENHPNHKKVLEIQAKEEGT
jgi:hypothetical protein